MYSRAMLSPLSALVADEASVCRERSAASIVRWTWVSMKPGLTVRCDRSIVCASVGRRTDRADLADPVVFHEDLGGAGQAIGNAIEHPAADQYAGGHFRFLSSLLRGIRGHPSAVLSRGRARGRCQPCRMAIKRSAKHRRHRPTSRGRWATLQQMPCPPRRRHRPAPPAHKDRCATRSGSPDTSTSRSMPPPMPVSMPSSAAVDRVEPVKPAPSARRRPRRAPARRHRTTARAAQPVDRLDTRRRSASPARAETAR